MVNIPKQLQNKEFRFVLLGSPNKWKDHKTNSYEEKHPKDYKQLLKENIWKPLGKAPYEKDWQNKDYTFNHKQVKQHEANIGIIGGYGRLRFLDIDNVALGKALEETMKTFTVQTGSGGKHFYFYSDYETNHVLINDLGEVRANNYQVVCPPSIHPNGNQYIIHKDIEIREISKEELLKIIGPYLKSEISNTQTTIKESDPTRSAKEYREVCSLISRGKNKEEVFKEMESYSKWVQSPQGYRDLTYSKALDFIKNNKDNSIKSKPKEESIEELEVCTDEYLSNYEIKDQEWLIENQIPKGEVGLLVGKRGERKSFIAQYQALCLASGKDVFNDKVTEKKKVLWIDEEQGINELSKRTKILKNGLDIKEALNIKYIPRSSLKLDKLESKRFAQFKKILLDFQPDLVIVDCLQRVVSFEVDKDNSKISELFTETVRPLSKLSNNCSWLFIHHLRKGQSNYKPEDPLDEVRGGSELVNYCRFVLMSETPKNQIRTEEGGEMAVFKVLKMSNAEMPQHKAISFTNTENALKIAYEGIPEDVLRAEVRCANAIKDYLVNQQMTSEFQTKDLLEASDKIGFQKTMISKALKVLVKDCFLDKQKRGFYKISSNEIPKQKKLENNNPKETNSNNELNKRMGF